MTYIWIFLPFPTDTISAWIHFRRSVYSCSPMNSLLYLGLKLLLAFEPLDLFPQNMQVNPTIPLPCLHILNARSKIRHGYANFLWKKPLSISPSGLQILLLHLIVDIEKPLIVISNIKFYRSHCVSNFWGFT